MTKSLTFVTGCVSLCFLLSAVGANWYGKRGEKVESTLLSLLEGNMSDLVTRKDQDDRETLRAIGKILKEWQMRQAIDPPILAEEKGNNHDQIILACSLIKRCYTQHEKW
ncbi:hypothetical protein ACJMK2_008227 [Sinanodonta woodiana]|uniref:Uncharacterized protein n=1 Tax=Sinanodonta woodiana TaxID=1069815 RepID=A0ABD3VNW6_SINWO